MKHSRRDFAKGTLLEDQVPSDPYKLLEDWYQAAVGSGEFDANAMSLSTLDEDGYPVSRIVLMRGLSTEGITFFTNYLSAKGRQLDRNPKAEVQFLWKGLERQVRVRGRVERISSAESDQYFASRPRDSQLGAWASPQSQFLASREELEQRLEEQANRFSGEASIPRPPHWGGFRLVPLDFEFWQGRPNRLHDRLKAFLKDSGSWTWRRLAP
jgi:pyridoxamine 5'-phosphate oxidase